MEKIHKYRVIAFTTKNDYYEELSKKLEKSCIEFNIPIYLEKIDSKGKWTENTHYKPKFIKDCMIKFNDEYLLYTDVDSFFKGYPSFFDEIDCDISFRIENFKHRKNEPLSGTIFIKNNKRILELVDLWIELNEKTPSVRNIPETWEQMNLLRALEKLKNINYINFPPEYCYVDRHTKIIYPDIIPIIYHTQASRITCN